ncbi:MAG TPA: hypothetical protein DDW65_03875 [Firmicutes bacterium]|nr:hypothetical protein [Bacillota bacterium]
MKKNFELRAIAREKLKGKWLYAVLVCFIATIISGLLCWIPFIGFIYTLIISGPIALGLATFFLNLRRDQNPLIENLFDGFKSFSPALILQLWITLFTFLWTLLLVIPGIIATLRYSLSFYILRDHPELKPKEALERSKQIMKGRKGKLFLLGLSFIGWGLLAVLTLSIGFLWLVPYINASLAGFYEDVKDAPLASGTSAAATTA